MYALEPSAHASQKPTVTPNFLPCRVHHDGPIDVSKRYWDPSFDEGQKDTATAHLRGRKLRGRRVPLPAGYKGVLATPTSKPVESAKTNQPQNQRNVDIDYCRSNPEAEEDDEEDEEPEPTAMLLETQGSFSEFMVWDHEKVPAADDPFVKGVGEWIRFAQAMHLGPSGSAPDPASASAGDNPAAAVQN